MLAPAFLVRLLLGEFGNVILKGQRVLPRRLLKSGFVFQFPEIQGALDDILRK
jgi:NAD dependent epimerase/dehydratase family enzyme